MKRGLTGYYLPGAGGYEPWKAFVPAPLPPVPPPEIDAEIQQLLESATLALGRLDGLAVVLPETDLFLYTYVRKEAVLSSQIEGTQSSLSDLLLFEVDAAPGAPLDDVQEVSRYVAAMTRGLKRINEGFPVSVRLMKELHSALLARGRGSEKQPGEFRTSQNWIGGTRPGNAAFVPPPPEYVLECVGELEKFLNDENQRLPVLIKAALAHVQFETIHPFLDGNGRIGRLLITLYLCSQKLLNEPLLYLSLFFKENRDEYYRLLQAVRTEGDWEEWLRFFLRGVRETAERAAAAAQKLMSLAAKDAERIQKVGRSAGSALRVHQCLQRQPITTIRAMSAATGLSVPTVTKALQVLQQLRIARPLAPKFRNRTFAYDAYLKTLND